jgi:hypothetical protein
MKKTRALIVFLALILAVAVSATRALAQTPTPQPAAPTSGDQWIIANTFRLYDGDTLNGNLGVIGGTVFIEKGSTVNKSAFVIGGTLTVDGTIRGDIIAIGGALNLNDTAVIEGNITLVGATLNRSPHAILKGQLTEQSPTVLNFNAPPTTPPISLPAETTSSKLIRLALEALFLAALAVVAALLFPDPVKRVAKALAAQPLTSAAVGILFLIGFPIVLVIMVVTILLIPVAILAVFALALIILYGWIAIGYELGSQLSTLFHSTWHTAVAAGIGTLVLSLVAFSAGIIPYVGGIIELAFVLAAIGSVIMGRFGSNRGASLPRVNVPSNPPPIDVPPA